MQGKLSLLPGGVSLVVQDQMRKSSTEVLRVSGWCALGVTLTLGAAGGVGNLEDMTRLSTG